MFNRSYRSYGETQLAKAAQFSEEISRAGYRPVIGHPDYEYLQVGETDPGTIVAFFMDIRGFTKLAIARPNTDVVRVLQAILAASIVSVLEYDGHVADFTGDGIMALFGGRDSTDEDDAYRAVSAAAFLMDGIREVVSARLLAEGYPDLRVGMGIEYGEVLWTRLGLPAASQVKPISGISFLAGKLCSSKFTDSWECKIGENIATWLLPDYKTEVEPYEFDFEGKRYRHGIFTFDWEKFHTQENISPMRLEQVAKARRLPTPTWPVATSAALATTENQRPSGAPRPLKDQPFYAIDG